MIINMYLYELIFRFAAFMETSAHVSPEAVEEYEKEIEDSENDFEDESESDISDSFDDIKKIEYSSDSE